MLLYCQLNFIISVHAVICFFKTRLLHHLVLYNVTVRVSNNFFNFSFNFFSTVDCNRL